MGLISDLLGLGGKSKKARTIADVEAAIARLGEERRAAKEAIATALGERDELLLVDGSDAKIADLDASTDRHRLSLERLEKSEPLLLAELQSLRDEAKQARWRALAARYDASAAAFAAALRGAIEAHETLTEIRGEAQIGGFATEAAVAFTFAPVYLARDLLDRFEAALDHQRDVAAAQAHAAAAPAPAPQAGSVA